MTETTQTPKSEAPKFRELFKEFVDSVRVVEDNVLFEVTNIEEDYENDHDDPDWKFPDGIISNIKGWYDNIPSHFGQAQKEGLELLAELEKECSKLTDHEFVKTEFAAYRKFIEEYRADYEGFVDRGVKFAIRRFSEGKHVERSEIRNLHDWTYTAIRVLSDNPHEVLDDLRDSLIYCEPDEE